MTFTFIFIFHFSGIGWASVVVCAIGMPYYVCLMAYGVFYMFASFSSELPWATCGHEWNTAGKNSQQLINIPYVYYLSEWSTN